MRQAYLFKYKPRFSGFSYFFCGFLLLALMALVACQQQTTTFSVPTRPLVAEQPAVTVESENGHLEPISLPPTMTPLLTTETPEPFLPVPTITVRPTVAVTAVSQQYIVQPGDTLLALAIRFGVTMEALMQVNSIENPGLIVAGRELTIPPPSAVHDALEIEENISYQVQLGETFISIATKFGVNVDTLQRANPGIDPESLQAGSTIQIPWGGVHIVGPGDTLIGLAIRYGVNYDDLVQVNNKTLNLTNLDHIEVGWRLRIPFDGFVESDVVVDCEPGPPRTEVIGHLIEPGEGLFCLVRRFGVSDATLLNANPHIMGEGRFQSGKTIIVPPSDGAVYVVTEEDIDLAITLADIAQWYGVQEDQIMDRYGQSPSDPLESRQLLFLPQADVLAGKFDAAVLRAFAQSPPPSSPPQTTGSTPVAAMPTLIASSPPSGDGEFTYNRLWMRPVSMQDPGHCSLVNGEGWSGSLTWPSDSRQIQEGQGFRPGHNGIDIIMKSGSPVYAAETGVVIWAGYSSFAGGIPVILAHGNGWRTYYYHLQEPLVTCGQVVQKGEIIALSGQTGTFWPHLHFEVEHAGTKYDPLNWLP